MCQNISNEEMERRKNRDERAREQMISEGGPIYIKDENEDYSNDTS